MKYVTNGDYSTSVEFREQVYKNENGKNVVILTFKVIISGISWQFSSLGDIFRSLEIPLWPLGLRPLFHHKLQLLFHTDLNLYNGSLLVMRGGLPALFEKFYNFQAGIPGLMQMHSFEGIS